MRLPLHLLAVVFFCICALASGVRRHDDTPDGHMLAADTVEKAKEALAEGANIDVQDELNGQTALMRATLHGWTSLVIFLLDQGANVKISEKDGYTPPHGAGFQGRVDILKELRNRNVDIFAKSKKDKFTPFHRACWGREERHTETVRFFIQQGVDVNLKGGKEKQTCFQMTPNKLIKALLVEHGAGSEEL